MIRIENLCITLPGFSLDSVSLHVKRGEFYALMGPTGSGKSLVLESVAGLSPKTSGKILLDGRDITALPPEQRNVSIVYQDHSLFPHLTVLENVMYGQRYHDISEKNGLKMAMDLLEMLGLAKLAERKPERLSGGEKQRVSIARALACKPDVVLLDEPLSSLDPQFKQGLRQTLGELHQDSAITFLMVTHDFVDALTLADRAAVIRSGRIEQSGTVSEIFHRPATPFVAGFVGMSNVLPASFSKECCMLCDQRIPLCDEPFQGLGFAALRPEDVIADVRNDFPDEWTSLSGTLLRIERHGFSWLAILQCGQETVTATLQHQLAPGHTLSEGATLFAGFPKRRLHVMPTI